MPKVKTVISNLEADLATLVKRSAGLEKRRDEAAAVLAAVTADRRRLLVEHDAPPAADLTKAERACREATDTRDAAVDALEEIEARITDLRARIDGMKAAGERDAQAKAIEASATQAEAAILRIRKAAAEIETARDDLAAAILPTTAGCYTPISISGDAADRAGRGGPGVLSTVWHGYDGKAFVSELPPEDVASRLAGHILAAALPGYAITSLEEANVIRGNGMPLPVLTPAPNAAALDAIILAPTRALAATIRSGDAVAPTPAPATPLRVIRENAA